MSDKQAPSADGGLEQILRVRKDKARKLEEHGWKPYPNGLEVPHTTRDVRSDAASVGEEPGPNDPSFKVGVRITGIRSFGKVTFMSVRDRHGELQLQLRKDLLGETSYQAAKSLDLGDIVVAAGPRIVTRTGELTIQVREIMLATKSMYPLPDKHAGLTDVEQRYRQRYVDLIVNPEVRQTFERRAQLIRFIRSFLDQRDFMEVETPMLHPLIGGAAAKPFTTHHNALDMELYLRIAPELYLKRLVVGGFERVYEINRNFRNEGISTQHNPEFTMLEFYQAYATYEDLMNLTEEMFRAAALEVTGSLQVPFGGHAEGEAPVMLDFEKPFRRIPVREGLMEKLPGVDITNHAALLAAGEKTGAFLDPRYSVGRLQMDLFEHLYEKDLIQPTFVIGFPIEVSPLARRNNQDPTLADRFELYITGKEIANAFSELNDPEDQRSRFRAQLEQKAAGDQETMDFDEDYCHALDIGLPPTAGEGVGIDRLAMVLTNAASIRDVILFPLLRKL